MNFVPQCVVSRSSLNEIFLRDILQGAVVEVVRIHNYLCLFMDMLALLSVVILGELTVVYSLQPAMIMLWGITVRIRFGLSNYEGKIILTQSV